MGKQIGSESDVDHYHESLLNTARIARIVLNVAVYRAFLRSVNHA
jgi:hypothetical protein